MRAAATRHVLHNAAIPVITGMALKVGNLLVALQRDGAMANLFVSTSPWWPATSPRPLSADNGAA